jgi:hypothetical protein
MVDGTLFHVKQCTEPIKNEFKVIIKYRKYSKESKIIKKYTQLIQNTYKKKV